MYLSTKTMGSLSSARNSGNEPLVVYLVVGQHGRLETFKGDSIGIMISGHKWYLTRWQWCPARHPTSSITKELLFLMLSQAWGICKDLLLPCFPAVYGLCRCRNPFKIRVSPHLLSFTIQSPLLINAGFCPPSSCLAALSILVLLENNSCSPELSYAHYKQFQEPISLLSEVELDLFSNAVYY